MFTGVPSSSKNGLAPRKEASPKIRLPAATRYRAWATQRFIRSCCPAPSAWEITTLTALVRPWPNMMIREVVELVAPMAARASTLANRPTTKVSVMLYISWNTAPMSMGMAKSTSSRAGSPFVMSRLAAFRRPLAIAILSSLAGNFRRTKKV